jgi:hypothetical protein
MNPLTLIKTEHISRAKEKAMKTFALVLFLLLNLGIANAQNSKCVPTSEPRDDRVQLKLTTSITEARYSVEHGSRLLHLTLNLEYRNTGSRPILLDKKSSFIYRKIITKDIVSLAACKYLYDASSHPIGVEDMEKAGFRAVAEPERSEFVVLKPKESLNLKKEIILRLYDGTKDTEDNLHPGNYVMQVRVAAWFYFADPVEWEEKWGNEAYLWSENVTSEPMSLTIKEL